MNLSTDGTLFTNFQIHKKVCHLCWFQRYWVVVRVFILPRTRFRGVYVSPSVLTNCVLYLNFMKLNIQWLTMMCKLQVGCSSPLRLPFGLQFDPIQYASCHHISSDNVWWVHLKVIRLVDLHMQMCMNRRYGPLNLEILNLSSMHLDIATPLTWYDGYTGKFVDC